MRQHRRGMANHPSAQDRGDHRRAVYAPSSRALAGPIDRAWWLRGWLVLAALLFPLATLAAGLGGGSNLLGGQPQFLRVHEAFVLTTRLDGQVLVADWRIVDGYYLYRDRLTVTAEAGSGVVLGPLQVPEGKHKTDEYFGDVEVYYGGVTARVPVRAGKAGARVQISYQGCADAGLCYPPERVWFVLPSTIGAAGAAAVAAAPPPNGDPVADAASPESVQANRPDGNAATESAVEATAQANPPADSPASDRATPAAPAAGPAAAASVVARAAAAPQITEESRLAAVLAGSGVFTSLALFFIAGIGLAFTPCVLPMVPILSSIIVGRGEPVGRGRAFALSLAYVLGMALTYAALGTLVGLFGGELNLQARFQSPPVLIAAAAIFVALALAMFGLYELRLPAALTNRLNDVSSQQSGGRLGSVAVMGALSALVVSPCVSAPLVGALIYLSTTGDAVLGGAALLALGLGMGLPLLLVGVGGAHLLPRAGGWMVQVKGVFGVLLLGVAIWLLERLLPGPLVMALWAALCIGCAVFLGALDRGDGRAAGGRLAQGVGVLALVWGVLLSIGAASGASDPLRPLGRLAEARAEGPAAAAVAHQFTDVRGPAGVDAAIAAAVAAGEPVLLDLYADWCISCKVMERSVFPQPEVAAAMAKFRLLRADVTANDALDRALLERFGLFGPPSMLFFDPRGVEQQAYRLQGERSASEFAAHLRAVLESS